MPRLRAGISGSPLISSAKRSLALHVKSKPNESRSPNKHISEVLKKETTLPINKLDNADHVPATSVDSSKESTSRVDCISTDTQSIFEKMCKQLDMDTKNLTKIDINSSSSNSNQNKPDEVERLKQLMHLQISLIASQQDLLKLRDKEIMQLKTQTQSYKNRLERMERRILLSRRQTGSTSVISNNERSLKHGKSTHSDLNVSNMDTVEVHTDNVVDDNSANQPESSSQNPPLHNVSYKDDKISSPLIKLKTTATETFTSFSSPVSLVQSAYTASGYMPVPVSYLERFKTDHPSTATDFSSAKPVVVKVCDNCPQCSAIVKEIKQELPALGMFCPVSTSSNLPSPTPKSEVSDMELNEVSLHADHSYHLITWSRDDQSYPFTDLDFSLDEGSTLNIPTWRNNKLTPLFTGSHCKEPVDDDAFLKRHSRLEIAEKRRKRWDIQRIREYRYNEKLRQKQLKQAKDLYSIDTFSPSLSDITALQVDESLPVNVFGHSLQPLLRKEFSLDNES